MNILLAAFYALSSNFYMLNKHLPIQSIVMIALLIGVWINLLPGLWCKKLESRQLEQLRNGNNLLIIFLISTSMTGMILFGGYQFNLLTWDLKVFLMNLLYVFLFEFVLFWNGIIRIYLYSKQIGIKWKVIGILCGMIPIAHLIILIKMIKVVKKEVDFENHKLLCNKQRQQEKICKTKYPILFVHGVFFRDSNFFNYWGRIPEELEKNGATVFYGNQESAASISKCGEELAMRIKEILKETNFEKVNIIAHSKGGLDSRYALSKCGMDQYVASLTTINTPHRGCEFADFLLEKINEKLMEKIAEKYNSTLIRFGDRMPNFKEAIYDLTSKRAKEFNENIKNVENVYYQSTGSKLNKLTGGRFPLNLTTIFVKYFDGPNDGLVGYRSFEWGENYIYLTVDGKRGISHGDMIDLNRENIDGFDVREFYVQLVRDLKDKGF